MNDTTWCRRPLLRHHRSQIDHPQKGIPMKQKNPIALVTGASSGIVRRGAQAGRQSWQSFEMLPLNVTSDESVEA